ncbi:MAG: undecaprenyl diphosphate synthase family protein [Halobacteria archaeon]|nr:undecaprenyl diphosphate synthase family protein [Halobacteria archaeon]
MSIYDRFLERKIKKGKLPDHITLIITETDLLEGDGFEILNDFLEWCLNLGTERVSVYVSLLESNEAVLSRLREGLESMSVETKIRYRGDESSMRSDMDSLTESQVVVSIGIEGKKEFVHALRRIAKKVKEGDVNPSEIDEGVIEDNLIFKGEPDIIVKTGGEHLSNFMIWQSVYSEIHFADFNWHNLRKRDFLRTIRDYQERERRYGE